MWRNAPVIRCCWPRLSIMWNKNPHRYLCRASIRCRPHGGIVISEKPVNIGGALKRKKNNGKIGKIIGRQVDKFKIICEKVNRWPSLGYHCHNLLLNATSKNSFIYPYYFSYTFFVFLIERGSLCNFSGQITDTPIAFYN